LKPELDNMISKNLLFTIYQ